MLYTISVSNKNISVELYENRIAILYDVQLLALITEMPEAATDELVFKIKAAFHRQFKKDFVVKNNSIAVEIWGHVFSDKFADALKAITEIKLVHALAEKISSRCEVINIGSRECDGNRFAWDLLAVFKPAIAALLLKAD